MCQSCPVAQCIAPTLAFFGGGLPFKLNQPRNDALFSGQAKAKQTHFAQATACTSWATTRGRAGSGFARRGQTEKDVATGCECSVFSPEMFSSSPSASNHTYRYYDMCFMSLPACMICSYSLVRHFDLFAPRHAHQPFLAVNYS